MVAFATSLIIGLLALVPLAIMMKRRRIGSPLTWGQAMVAAQWSFFTMFWWYGVIPHQWLTWADNELNWRRDKVWHGPGNLLDKLPFDMNYLIARDFLVVFLYLGVIGLNAVLFAAWQNREKTKKTTTELARSEYGRPLVKA